MSPKYFAFTALCTTALLGTAFANEPTENSRINGYVGAGIMVTPDYEGSDEFQAVPLLAARVQYENYYHFFQLDREILKSLVPIHIDR